jgi:hypothetical protein
MVPPYDYEKGESRSLASPQVFFPAYYILERPAGMIGLAL